MPQSHDIGQRKRARNAIALLTRRAKKRRNKHKPAEPDLFLY